MSLDFSNLPKSIRNQLPFDLSVPQIKPSTNNQLTNNRFTFFLRRCPILTHFCQRVNLPSISFGTSIQENPTGIEIRRPGTRYALEEINVGFIVDENMQTWLEIYNWMKSIGIYEHNHEVLRESDKISDAYLIITNSAFKPIVTVAFHNIFPVLLSSIDLDVSVLDVDPVLANATFSFTHYDITVL